MATIVAQTLQQANAAVEYIRLQLPENLSRPIIGIICGSGLGGLAETVEAESQVEISYKNIPHFPQSTGIKTLHSFESNRIG